MRRIVLGLLAATFATPYLIRLLWIFVTAFQGGTISLQTFIDALTFRPLDGPGLLRLFASKFFLSGAIAFVLYALQWRRSWQAVGVGLLIRTILSAGVLFEPMMRMEHILLILTDRAVEGAMTGWIYWLVAIRSRMHVTDWASSPTSATADISNARIAPTMKRQLLGLLAATMAAPYLVVLFASSLGRDLTSNSYGWRPSLEDILFYGTFGLVLFGLPLLAVAGIAIAVLTRLGWASLWTALLAGAVIGSVSIAVMYGDGPIDTLLGAVSGAICGWIYWTIALQQRPDAASSPEREAEAP